MSKKENKESNKKQLTLTTQKVRTSQWYHALLDEVDAVRVETVYTAATTLLGGKLEIGKLITEKSKELPVTELVQYIAMDLKVSERDLWYCVKFFEMFPKIEKNPEYNSKAVSWNKVKKLITGPKTEKPCEHKHTIKIVCCEDCGKKLDK